MEKATPSTRHRMLPQPKRETPGVFKLPRLEPLELTFPEPFREAPSCDPSPSKNYGRKLDYVVDKSDQSWPTNCDQSAELCAVLKEVAIDREVLVAVANSHAPGLDGFIKSIQELSVTNFLVVALDEALVERLKARNVPYYFRKNHAQGNHAVSAEKFGIVREFVEVGCSVLLTDTDVVYLQNPFKYLYRDTDIEGMSDGWDRDSAHGYFEKLDDPRQGWARRKSGSRRLICMNSGLWYVAATEASRSLMVIMQHRLKTEELWDQTGYNLELFLPTHDDHQSAGCTTRVMNPVCFVNSKVMYRHIRHHLHDTFNGFVPVAMHSNYHTDKEHKMSLVNSYYKQGVATALNDCRGHGCDPDVLSVEQIELLWLNYINDGFFDTFDWTMGRAGGSNVACRPQPAWAGKFDFLKRPLHRLSPPAPGVCEGSDLCLALRKAAPPGSEVLVATVSSDAISKLELLVKAVKRLGLQNLFLVALDELAANYALQQGVAHIQTEGPSTDQAGPSSRVVVSSRQAVSAVAGTRDRLRF
eukprot:gene5086-6190_t